MHVFKDEFMKRIPCDGCQLVKLINLKIIHNEFSATLMHMNLECYTCILKEEFLGMIFH